MPSLYQLIPVVSHQGCYYAKIEFSIRMGIINSANTLLFLSMRYVNPKWNR